MLAAILDRLPRACLEGAVFVVLIAIVCRLAPRLPARYRAALWWLASAKLLFALIPLSPLALEVLPPAVAVPLELAEQPPIAGASHVIVAPPASSIDLRSVFMTVWAFGAALLFAASVPGAWRARVWRKTGVPVDDPALDGVIRDAASAAGLHSVPDVRWVDGLPGPLVVGLVRPAVLLPVDAPARLSRAELAMALEHEMTHLARRDLWLGLVPATARRLLFFHPLAWLAEREYAIAREAACDEAVVGRAGADVFAYGKLLLRLAVPRPAATATFSPRSVLRRRLEMIESTVRRSPLHARVAWALVALAMLAFVPVKLVAREAPPAPPAPPTPVATPAPEAPVAEPGEAAEGEDAWAPAPVVTPEAPETPGTPAPRAMPRKAGAIPPPPTPRGSAAPMALPAPPSATTPAAAPVPPTPPPAPRAPVAPTPAPRARRSSTYIGNGGCLDMGDPKKSAYVIVSGDTGRLCGDPSLLPSPRSLSPQKQDVIIFRVDDETYVISDQAAIDETLAVFMANSALPEAEARLADERAVLHERQAAMTERQMELAEAQARAADELVRVNEMKKAEIDARTPELARKSEMAAENLARIENERVRTSEQRSKIAAELDAHAAMTQDQISRMIREAMRNGTARKIQ
jgi:beta-lactamase regulating signal transducer with metallopeptidase domain